MESYASLIPRKTGILSGKSTLRGPVAGPA